MITYDVLAGSTDVSVVIRIIDSADGTPETGVVFNTSGIDLQYRRELAASTAITEATLAALTTAHADGGFLHIGNGYYRLDLPDAAVAAGVSGCLVHGTVTGMIVIGCYINLTPVAADVRQWLGTAAATPTVAGVPEVDLTYIAGSAVSTSTAQLGVNAVQAGGTAWGSGAITAASIAADAITDAKVASDVTIASVTGAVGSVTGNVGGNVTGSVGSVATGGITAASIAADAIGASELAADAVAEIADAIWDEAMSGHTTSGTFGQRLQAIRTGTAQAGAAGSITLDASASAVDDFYKNALVVITAGTGANQCRTVSGYTGSTKVATITPNWGTNPSSDSVFFILPTGAIAGATAPTAGEVADAVWDEARAGHVSAGTFGEYIPANVTTWLGTAAATPTVAGVPEVDVTHFGGSAGTFASGVPAVNATQVSGDSTAADNIENAFDDTAGAVRWLGIVDQGTAQSATGTTLVLRSAAAFADDELIGATIQITGGSAGVGQTRVITGYVSSTDTATVDTWTTTPTGTITYRIFGTPPGSASAPVPAQVVAVSAAGLADFFDTNSGTTYASAVAGSVVKEIADNAAGGGLDAAGVRAAVGLAAANLDTQLSAIDNFIDTEVAAIVTTLGTPAGVSVSADIAAVKAETASILTDTAEIGTAGAGLTNINLPNQTMDIVGNITGNLSGSVGSVTGAVGSVTGAVGSVGTGGIAAASFAAGAIDAAAIAANAIGASELAADAATEIATAVLTAAAAAPIAADVKRIATVVITGTGVLGDEFGP